MKKFVYIGGALIILISMVYTLMGSNDADDYKAEIKESREEQDRFMRFSDESPFAEKGAPFDSLKYFAPNPDFRIVGKYAASDDPEIIKLGTNDGEVKEYLTYGFAEFRLDGADHRLRILENVEEETLFIPFGDATSAEETYGAGRYLDVEHHGGRTIVLDFNTAYNPYCAYVDGYTCPLPPVENLLTAAVLAGEKSYH